MVGVLWGGVVCHLWCVFCAVGLTLTEDSHLGKLWKLIQERAPVLYILLDLQKPDVPLFS